MTLQIPHQILSVLETAQILAIQHCVGGAVQNAHRLRPLGPGVVVQTVNRKLVWSPIVEVQIDRKATGAIPGRRDPVS